MTTAAAMPTSFNLDGVAEIVARAAEDGKKAAPTVRMLAYSGGPIRVAGYDGLPVVVDLRGLRAHADRIPLLLNHDPSLIVGQADRVEISADSVELSGLITGNVDDAESPAGMVVAHARGGFKWPVSVGVRNEKLDFVEAGKSEKINGRSIAGPVYVVRVGVLGETSFVSFGADPSAAARIAASAAREGKSTMPDADSNAAVKAERDRVTQIRDIESRAVAAEFGALQPQEAATLRASAIDNGDTAEAFEARVNAAMLKRMRDERPKMNIVARGASGDADQAKLFEAVLLLKAGLPDVAVKHCGEAATQIAHDMRARHVLDIFAAAVQAEGKAVPRDHDGVIRAAFSTLVLPTALSDSIRHVALEQFTNAPSVWRSLCSIVPLQDFRETKGVRPTLKGSLEELGPGGELKHASADEETSSIKAKTKGRILGLRREDIINDDLGLLSTMPVEFARMADRSVSDDVFELLLGSLSTFFTEDRGNYLDGSSSVFSLTSVANAIALMRAMKDSDGRLIDAQPISLLVGATLEASARSLLNSSLIARTGADNLPQGSPVPPNLKLLVEPRIEFDGFEGATTTGWWLWGNPGDAVIVVGFLGGAQAPVIELVEQPADRLGISVRCYFDYGVGLGSYRHAVFSKGAA